MGSLIKRISLLAMSDLHPKADKRGRGLIVRFGPIADILPSIGIFNSRSFPKYQAAAVTDNLADKTVVFSTAAIPVISSRLSGA